MCGLILALTLLAIPSAQATEGSSQRVRKLHLKRDEIALVRTAVGIATIIQVPDRPTSVVLGDTEAFKVEYLENAITIKPLSRSSKSNLYVYTEGRRFNVGLITVPMPSSDYIVYLEPEISNAEPARETWRGYTAKSGNHDFTVTINRLGKSPDSLLVAFQIAVSKPIRLKPEWIWLTQGGRTVAIQDLRLSAIDATEKTPIAGCLSVKTRDLKAITPLVLEFRSQSPIKLKLPEVRAWLSSS